MLTLPHRSCPKAFCATCLGNGYASSTSLNPLLVITRSVKQYNGRDYVTAPGKCGIEGISGQAYQGFYHGHETTSRLVPDAATCAAIGQAYYDQGGAPMARCAQYMERLKRCDILYDLGHTPPQVGKSPNGLPSSSRPPITTAEGDSFKVTGYTREDCSGWNDDIKACILKFPNRALEPFLDTCASSQDACAVPATCADSCQGRAKDNLTILFDGCAA